MELSEELCKLAFRKLRGVFLSSFLFLWFWHLLLHCGQTPVLDELYHVELMYLFSSSLESILFLMQLKILTVLRQHCPDKVSKMYVVIISQRVQCLGMWNNSSYYCCLRLGEKADECLGIEYASPHSKLKFLLWNVILNYSFC